MESNATSLPQSVRPLPPSPPLRRLPPPSRSDSNTSTRGRSNPIQGAAMMQHHHQLDQWLVGVRCSDQAQESLDKLQASLPPSLLDGSRNPRWPG